MIKQINNLQKLIKDKLKLKNESSEIGFENYFNKAIGKVNISEYIQIGENDKLIENIRLQLFEIEK